MIFLKYYLVCYFFMLLKIFRNIVGEIIDYPLGFYVIVWLC